MTMRPNFVDFHTHLDLYPDLAGAIARCEERRTATLTVTTTPRAFARNRELAAESEFVRVALGLHPQLVEERAGELKLVERLLSETRYVGEVGLDAGPRHYRSLEQQKTVFRAILRLCAEAGDKILTVHSVRSARHVLDLVEEHLPSGRGTVVLHWFSGSAKEVRRGAQLGGYFSVNERMLESPNGQRVLREIPADRLLTETDGPFVKRGSNPIAPGDVRRAIALIAEIKGTPSAGVERLVVTNLRNVLRPVG